MLPIFFFGLADSSRGELNSNWVLHCLILGAVYAFSIFPASNGYNSFYDQDTESIGGLEKPPTVTKDLLFYSLLIELFGLVTIAFIFGFESFAALFLYGIFSKLYSHPKVRLKKYPWISWTVVSFFQGAVIYFVTIKAVSTENTLASSLLLGMLVSFLLIGANYPLTQIYQHRQDKERGDRTLSLVLGKQNTMLFSAVMMMTAILLMTAKWELDSGNWIFLFFALIPAMIHFKWSRAISKDLSQASFRRMSEFLVWSSTASNLGFFAVLLWRLNVKTF